MAIDRHNFPNTPEPRGYSHAVISDSSSRPRTLHLAGMGALSQDGAVPEGSSLSDQTRLALGRVLSAIEAVGAHPSDMIRRTTYVVDLTEEKVAEIQAVWMELLGPSVRPAATSLGVTSLAKRGMLVEIECTVAMP